MSPPSYQSTSTPLLNMKWNLAYARVKATRQPTIYIENAAKF